MLSVFSVLSLCVCVYRCVRGWPYNLNKYKILSYWPKTSQAILLPQRERVWVKALPLFLSLSSSLLPSLFHSVPSLWLSHFHCTLSMKNSSHNVITIYIHCHKTDEGLEASGAQKPIKDLVKVCCNLNWIQCLYNLLCLEYKIQYTTIYIFTHRTESEQ